MNASFATSHKVFVAVLVTVFAALCTFHVTTVRRPPPNDDEAVCANYIVTGGTQLWDKLFTAEEMPIVSSIYTFSLVPSQNAVFALSQKMLGCGPWQQRAITMACGLATLPLIFVIFARLGRPGIGAASALLFGISYPFFRFTHGPRPEPLILLVSLGSFFWLIAAGPSRIVAVLAGAAMASCFSLHPNVIIPLLTFGLAAVVWESEGRVRLPPRLVWWGIGLTAGVLVYLYLVDFDRALLALKFAKGYSYTEFPIVQYRWDVAGLLRHTIVSMNPNGLCRSLFPAMLGGAAAFVGLALRRWGTLSKGDRFIALVAAAAFLSHALLAASLHPFLYQAYAFPWLMAACLLLASNLIRHTWAIDVFDLSILGFSLLVFFLLPYKMSVLAGTWLLPVGFWLMVLAALRRNRLFFLISLAGVVVVLGSLDWGTFIGWMRHQLHFKPWRPALFSLWPFPLVWPFLSERLSYYVSRFLARPVWPRVLGLALLTIVVGHRLNEFMLQMRVPMGASTTPDLQEIQDELRKGRRIVGPAELWLYEPSENIQHFEMLHVGEALLSPAYNPSDSLRLFKPDMILVAPSVVRSLQESVRKKDPGMKLIPGRTYQLPFGNFVGLTVSS